MSETDPITLTGEERALVEGVLRLRVKTLMFLFDALPTNPSNAAAAAVTEIQDELIPLVALGAKLNGENIDPEIMDLTALRNIFAAMAKLGMAP